MMAIGLKQIACMYGLRCEELLVQHLQSSILVASSFSENTTMIQESAN